MAKCRHKSQFKLAKQKHMSMRENPGSGYVVKLDDLKAAVLKALPEAKQAQFSRAVEDAIGHSDALIEAISPYMKGLQLPIPEHVFELGDDDETGDELERHQWYVLFDESELYVRTPKAEFTRLKSLKVEPKFHNWAVFG
jgi:hypothetical protein